MKRFTTHIILLVISLSLSNAIHGQKINKEDKALYNEAFNKFENENFHEALQIFLEFQKKYPNDFEINYYTGACLLNTRYRKEEAIQYLTHALKLNEEKIPDIVYKDLGDLYHESYQFDKSIYHYKKFLQLTTRDDEFYDYTNQMLEICNNAIQLTRDTLNVRIKKLPGYVNTKNSEYAPLISADDSILFFSKLNFYTDEELAESKIHDTTSRIYMSEISQGRWGKPQEIEIISNSNVFDIVIAGMSPNGEQLYLSAVKDNNRDIYFGRYIKGEPLTIEPLPYPINTEFWEGKITVSPNGNTVWFSSDRPGGYGGIDLYKSTLKTDGNWSEPKNLGANINTAFNEDAPFIHPGGNLFYFSSNGLNTIGGYDIFSVLINEDKVQFPLNMGFPINTTGDDMFFSLAANGQSGYFSSTFGNKYKTPDIYNVTLSNNIPLTLVKGYIKVGNDKIPKKVTLSAIDNVTGEKLRYVYSPNPKTGRYLMIFPPARDYDIIVEAEGYIAKNINIYIPNQESFFELYQNIYLTPVFSSGKKVGEKLEVENVFFDTSSDTINKKDYSKLFDALDVLMEVTDSINSEVKTDGFEITIDSSKNKDFENLFLKLDDAFDLGNKEILNEIHENTLIPDRFNQVFFLSDDNTKQYLNEIKIGDDSVFVSPKLKAYFDKPRENRKTNELIYNETVKIDTNLKMLITERDNEMTITPLMIKKSNPNQQKTIITHRVFFDENKTTPNNNYDDIYDEIAELFVNNENIGLLITGYADSKGTIDDNKQLSRNRAINILQQLKEYGVSSSRVSILAKGEEEIHDEDMAFNRRVEIKVFEYIIINE